MIICFDVDDTLIDEHDQPVPELVMLANALVAAGQEVICWSGGGAAYARMWADRIGLDPHISAMAKDKTVRGKTPDIVIDDMAGWGKLQLIVKRGTGPAIIGDKREALEGGA